MSDQQSDTKILQKKFSLKFLLFEEIGVFSALVLMAAVLSLSTDVFLRPSNLLELSRQASYIGIMAIGMVFVISSGNIDLSVGAIYMLSPVITGLSLQAGISPAIAILLGLLTGITCGAINGALHIILKIPTLVISLGTMTIFRSIGLIASKGFPIHKFNKDGFFFEVIGDLIGPIPTSAIIWLFIAVIFTVVYKMTPFGNRVRGIGSNLQASRFSGVRVGRIEMGVMMINGGLCALGGILSMLFLKVSDPISGTGYELLVIAAAIIGGTSLEGGTGSVLGAIIGALIITVVRSGIVLLGIHYYWTGIITGALIIAAVFLDYFVRRRRTK